MHLTCGLLFAVQALSFGDAAVPLGLKSCGQEEMAGEPQSQQTRVGVSRPTSLSQRGHDTNDNLAGGAAAPRDASHSFLPVCNTD